MKFVKSSFSTYNNYVTDFKKITKLYCIKNALISKQYHRTGLPIFEITNLKKMFFFIVLLCHVFVARICFSPKLFY